MRIYEEEENQGKSWSLKLKRSDYDERQAMLLAVGSETGEKICNLVHFVDSGVIRTASGAYDLLESYGYDPHEHGNDFDDNGAIIVKSLGDCLM